MTLVRLGCLVTLALYPSVHTTGVFEQTLTSFGDASGTWEAATTADGVVDVLHLWGTRVVEMLRRDAGRDAESGRADADLTWDGKRLRARVVSQVHPRSFAVVTDPRDTVTTDLDLVFDGTQERWVGTFTRGGTMKQVELRRPGRFAVGPSVQPFMGQWCPSSSADYPPVCFTIIEGADGVLKGSTTPAGGSTLRAGPCDFTGLIPLVSSCGVTVDVAPAVRTIFLGERMGICCPNWFTGRLSADGTHIDGAWTFGKSGGSSVSLVKVP